MPEPMHRTGFDQTDLIESGIIKETKQVML